MSISFEVSAILPGSPEEIYNAWLDSAQHSAMTGGIAEVSDKAGETFSAWDGYISGKNIELVPGKRIVQAWRTVEFSDDESDSHLEITFETHAEDTLVTIRHGNLPSHGMQYEQGWIDNYFEPMKIYFAETKFEIFEAQVKKEGKFTFVEIPFSPRDVWDAQPRYYVAGTINDASVRGTLGALGQEYFLRLSAAWLRENGIEPGQTVTVKLAQENR